MQPVVELTYNSRGNDFYLDMAAIHILESFRYTESVYGGGSFSMMFQTPLMDQIDVLMEQVKDGVGNVRWGYSVDGDITYTDRRRVVLTNVRIVGEHYNLVHVELSGICYGMYNLMYCRQRVYNGKTASEIVAEVAKLNGITGDPVAQLSGKTNRIKNTKRKLHVMQGHLNDWDFLRQEVMPLAVAEGGQSDLFLYIDKGSGMIMEYPDTDNWKGDMVFHFSESFSEARREVLSYETNYRDLSQRLVGSRNTKIIGYNPITKEPVETTVDEEESDFSYMRDATVHPKSPPHPTVLESTTLPDPELFDDFDVEEFGRRRWNKEARSLFETTISVQLTLDVFVGMIVRIEVDDASSHGHYLEGNYYVTEVVNIIEGGNTGTKITLQRRGMRKRRKN